MLNEHVHIRRRPTKHWFWIAFGYQGDVLQTAVCIALPAALIGFFLKLIQSSNWWGLGYIVQSIEISKHGFGCLSSLLGFLIVLRSSQSYYRWWNGCQLIHELNGCFYDALSSVVAFSKMSAACEPELAEFRRNMVCHFSLLTALCYHGLVGAEAALGSPEFSKAAMDFHVLGMQYFGETQIEALKHAPCRPSLVFHWIQSMMVEAIPQFLNMPPPILTRAFNELADGLVKFEDSTKVAFIPFPAQYTQATLCLMSFHWIFSPLTVCSFSDSPLMVGCLTFVFVLTFWLLFMLAEEMENPFGDDADDIPLVDLQRHINSRFRMLLTEAALRPEPINALCDDEAEWLRCESLAEIYGGYSSSSSEGGEEMSEISEISGSATSQAPFWMSHAGFGGFIGSSRTAKLVCQYERVPCQLPVMASQPTC